MQAIHRGTTNAAKSAALFVAAVLAALIVGLVLGYFAKTWTTTASPAAPVTVTAPVNSAPVNAVPVPRTTERDLRRLTQLNSDEGSTVAPAAEPAVGEYW